MEVAEPWVDCLLEEYFMQVRALGVPVPCVAAEAGARAGQTAGRPSRRTHVEHGIGFPLRRERRTARRSGNGRRGRGRPGLGAAPSAWGCSPRKR